MTGGIIVLALTTGVAIVGGKLLGLSPALAAGAFAGALTNTPALAAAAAQTGSTEPAVGYAISYPLGVLVTILIVSVIVGRKWGSPKDAAPAAGVGLVDISVEVSKPGPLDEAPGFADGSVRFSYLQRGDETRVVGENEHLQVGDVVVVVGPAEFVRRAREFLGRRVDEHLAHDRREVDYRRFLVSNPAIVGQSIGELDSPERFGGVATRVKRGDLDMLANEDLHSPPGSDWRSAWPWASSPSRCRAASPWLWDPPQALWWSA